MSVLLAGLPDEVPGITVNRLCASGMSAITMAAQAIRAGDADLIIAGGVESMTRAPWVQAKPEKAWAQARRRVRHVDRLAVPEPEARWPATRRRSRCPRPPKRSPASTASPATRPTRSRCESQQRAAAAIAAGRFEAEIVGVPTHRGEVLVDEGPRPETTLEVLAGLRPVVHGGSVVTAGNSSAAERRRLRDPRRERRGGRALRAHAARPRRRSARRPASPPRSWASARCPPPRRRSNAPASTSTTSARSSSTRRSRPSRSPSIRRLGLDPSARQRRRRRDRAGTSARLVGLATRRDPARTHGARAVALRPRDDVRRRRPGHGADRGAGLMTGESSAARSSGATTAWSRPSTAPTMRNAIDQATIDALHALCAELEAEPAHAHPHRRRRRVRVGRRHRRSCATGGADDARRGINAQAFIRDRTSCRCRSSPRSTGTRSAAAPSSRTRPTSASRTPAAQDRQPRDGPRHHRRRRRELAPARDRRRGARDRAAAHRAHRRRRRGARRSGSSSSCIPPTSCCAAAHAIADRIAANDRAATIAHQARAARRRAPRTPAIDLERQAELFESPEKHAAHDRVPRAEAKK